MKQRLLHMIGNAHIDPVWLWNWQEGFHEVHATFRSALDRMAEDKDFIFVASSAAFYEWVEQVDRPMFEEIGQRIAEGRWQVVGGWWIEPDCNIPSGESFVRQGLYGQRYFKAKFGVTATVGFNVDSFGHMASLPQILKKSGIDSYVFLRPMPHEKSLPGRLFRWEAGDGSQVLAFRIPYEYLSWGDDITHHVRRCADEMKAPIDEFMCFYGVGNHGGGPTRANLELIHRLDDDPDFPRLQFSTPDAFFANVSRKGWHLPTVTGDLQRHASGCYAAHSGIKRWNRRAEQRLLTAEKWSVLARHALGQSYPTDFDRAWKSVLFNQFHDILAGTSLETAYDDARDAYGEATAIADRHLNHALQAFAWNIRIPQEARTRPFVVFNPHPWPVRTTVELESDRWPQTAMMVDDQGQPVPFQAVQSTTITHRARMCFQADLPALGYRTYTLRLDGEPAAMPTVQASDTSLENERFRLELDPQTGCIARLYDKQAGVEVFRGQAAVPVVIDDPSDTWGHDTYRFDRPAGTFQPVAMRLVEHGPAKSVIRVDYTYGHSRLAQEFTLCPGRDQVDLHLTVDWHEQFKLLKLRFPVHVHFMRVTHEIPYGFLEHFANGEEAPLQTWVDVSGIAREKPLAYGFSLLNDSKYSMDVNVNDIGLTILRSPPYAHHIPHKVPPDGRYSFLDQGIQHVKLTLLPHTESWERTGTVQRAAELNQPPLILAATFHPQGSLPPAQSFIEVSAANVVVSALKQAEDGDDIILRAYESTGCATAATIQMPLFNRTIETQFGPSEIKTFRIPADPALPISEVSLLEWDL